MDAFNNIFENLPPIPEEDDDEECEYVIPDTTGKNAFEFICEQYFISVRENRELKEEIEFLKGIIKKAFPNLNILKGSANCGMGHNSEDYEIHV